MAQKILNQQKIISIALQNKRDVTCNSLEFYSFDFKISKLVF
jgi:uncharacterized protein YhbP (UPF0306 family)